MLLSLLGTPAARAVFLRWAWGSATSPPSAAGGPCSPAGHGLSPAQPHHRGRREMAPPSVSCAGAASASCGLFSGAGLSPDPLWGGSGMYVCLCVFKRV